MGDIFVRNEEVHLPQGCKWRNQEQKKGKGREKEAKKKPKGGRFADPCWGEGRRGNAAQALEKPGCVNLGVLVAKTKLDHRHPKKKKVDDPKNTRTDHSMAPSKKKDSGHQKRRPRLGGTEKKGGKKKVENSGRISACGQGEKEKGVPGPSVENQSRGTIREVTSRRRGAKDEVTRKKKSIGGKDRPEDQRSQQGRHVISQAQNLRRRGQGPPPCVGELLRGNRVGEKGGFSCPIRQGRGTLGALT